MKKIAFHQPNFLPNLGFFYKMALVDIFVIGTNCQFSKREGWQRRHKVPGTSGEDVWLTVATCGSSRDMIKDIRLTYRHPWQRKIVTTLLQTYATTPYLAIRDRFIDILNTKHERLVDLNMSLIRAFVDTINVPTSLILDETTSGTKESLILNYCKAHGGSVYYSGMGAKCYMNDNRQQYLQSKGVAHRFIEKNVTGEYPYTTLHYLLTKGPEWVKSIVTAFTFVPNIEYCVFI